MSRQAGELPPFDPNGYRKTVLAAVERRGGPDTSDPFELYDLPLDRELSGELDDAAVAERVAEVWAFWQRQRDHPRYRALVALLVETHAARSAELLDADTRQRRRGQGARPPRGARCGPLRAAGRGHLAARPAARRRAPRQDRRAGGGRRARRADEGRGRDAGAAAPDARTVDRCGTPQADPGAARRVRPSDRGRSPSHAARAARARAVGERAAGEGRVDGVARPCPGAARRTAAGRGRRAPRARGRAARPRPHRRGGLPRRRGGRRRRVPAAAGAGRRARRGPARRRRPRAPAGRGGRTRSGPAARRRRRRRARGRAGGGGRAGAGQPDGRRARR